MDKLKDLLPDLSELVKFADSAAFKKYKAKHKMRPTTQVQIGGKKTTAGEEEPKNGDVKEKPTKDNSKQVEKPSLKSPYGAKQAGIGAGASNLTGPKTDDDSISGTVEGDRAVIEKIRAMDGKDDPDLCSVQVPGTNLFCKGNKNIPRDEMPQLKSKPIPDSPVDKLVKAGKLKQNAKTGEVNTEPLFKNMLEKEGIKTTEPTPMKVSELKATQNQLVGAKVKMFADVLAGDYSGDPDSTVDANGNKNPNGPDGNPNTNKQMAGWQKDLREPIMVSKDEYILDGHHRWAALVQHDMVNGGGGDVEMDVKRVDMGAEELVKRTNKFTTDMGLEVKAAETSKKDDSKKEKNESFIRLKSLVNDILSQ